MENPQDIKIQFKTRGDDIEMLKQAISLVPLDNKLLISYLCYLKYTIMDQLNYNFPKEEYPIGSPKGLTWEEAEKLLFDNTK